MRLLGGGVLGVLIIPFLTIFFFNSCLFLVDDRSPAAIEKGFLSLEVDVGDPPNGDPILGSAQRYFPAGSQTLDHTLKIMTLGEGELQFSGCGYDRKILHSNFEIITIDLKSIFGDFFDANETCILSIVDTYKFQEQEKQAIIVYPVKARIAFFITDKKPLTFPIEAVFTNEEIGVSGSQLRESELPHLVHAKTPVNGGKFVTICGNSSQQGNYSTSMIDILFERKTIENSCLHLIGVKPSSGNEMAGAYFLNVFKKDYVDLAPPKIEKTDKKILVHGADTVSFIIINDKVFNQQKAEVDVVPGIYKFKTITSKGRATLTFGKVGRL